MPESAKFGPLTPSQRGRYLFSQMKKGITHWFECNWPYLLAALLGALLGVIVANILTGGAIMAALPIVMDLLTLVMAGIAVARVMSYVGSYLSEGWAGQIGAAAKSLARGIAVGAVELIFALLFNLGSVIKAAKAAATVGVRATAKAAVASAKASLKATLKGAKSLVGIAESGGRALVKNSKLIFTGVRDGIGRGAHTLGDLAKQLFRDLKFKRFGITLAAGEIDLWGYFNPRIKIARIRFKQFAKKLLGVNEEAAARVVKAVSSDASFIAKNAAVFEHATVEAGRAKKVVDKVVSKLAAKETGRYGIPDGIKPTATGLIHDVEEAKYYGPRTLERMGKLAESDPRTFVKGASGKPHIQINRHVETIEAIARDEALTAGTAVTGVSKEVRYVVILPEFAGKELGKVRQAVTQMKKAWKDVLGLDVIVRHAPLSTRDVQSITGALLEAVGK